MRTWMRSQYLPGLIRSIFKGQSLGGAMSQMPIFMRMNPPDQLNLTRFRVLSQLSMQMFSFLSFDLLSDLISSYRASTLLKEMRSYSFQPFARQMKTAGSYPASTGSSTRFSGRVQNHLQLPELEMILLVFSKQGPIIRWIWQSKKPEGTSNPSITSTWITQFFCDITGAGTNGNQNFITQDLVFGLLSAQQLAETSSLPWQWDPSFQPYRIISVAQGLVLSLPFMGGPQMYLYCGGRLVLQRSAKSIVTTPINQSRLSLLQFQSQRNTYLLLFGIWVEIVTFQFQTGFFDFLILVACLLPQNFTITQDWIVQSIRLQGVSYSAWQIFTSRTQGVKMVFLSTTMASIVVNGFLMQLESWMVCLSLGPRMAMVIRTQPVIPQFSSMGSVSATQERQNQWFREKQTEVQSKELEPMTASRMSKDFLSMTLMLRAAFSRSLTLSPLKKKLNLESNMGLLVSFRTWVRLVMPMVSIQMKASQAVFSALNRKQSSFFETSSEASRTEIMTLQSPSIMLQVFNSQSSSLTRSRSFTASSISLVILSLFYLSILIMLLSFIIPLRALSVLSPPHLARQLSYRLLDFGHLPYGKTFVFTLQLFQPKNTPPAPQNQTLFVLIELGETEFSAKILQQIKNLGYKGVLFFRNGNGQNAFQSSLPAKSSLDIVAAEIDSSEGTFLRQVHSRVTCKIKIETRVSEKVAVTIFLDPVNRGSYYAFRQFYPFYQLIKQHLQLSLVWRVLPKSQCPHCLSKDCVSSYCLPGGEASGSTLLLQALTEWTLFEKSAQEFARIQKRIEKCTQPELSSCTKEAVRDQVSQSQSTLDKISSVFSQSKIDPFEDWISLQTLYAVHKYPFAVVNSLPHKGFLQGPDIFEQVCNSLLDPPSVCRAFLMDSLADYDKYWQIVGLLIWSVGIVSILLGTVLLLVKNQKAKEARRQLKWRVGSIVAQYMQFYSER